MLIDTHCHLSIEDYDDIDLVIKENRAAKVEKIIISGCTKESIKMLEMAGFCDISECEKLNAGDKVYFVNKEKALFACVIGNEKLEKGINIIGSHIDSPRLDLKPMPLYPVLFSFAFFVPLAAVVIETKSSLSKL